LTKTKQSDGGDEDGYNGSNGTRPSGLIGLIFFAVGLKLYFFICIN
jgi:hypothetical protein